MEHTRMLCDISELNHLFSDSDSVENFLQHTVELVARHLKTDVCSIYLYEQDKELLVLNASKGLNPDSVGKVSLELGQGLTGTALKELRFINIENASKHPQSKIFKETGEESFENFLALPIVRGIERIGVLVLQRKTKHPFTEQDILACRAVASQLAHFIENARFLISIHEQPEPVRTPSFTGQKIIKGRAASEGYAHSSAMQLSRTTTLSSLTSKHFERQFLLEDFNTALTATASQLEHLQRLVEQKLSDSASLIFASHLLILKDHAFVGEMESLITQGTNAPDAVLKVANKYIDIFAKSPTLFIREKVKDVEDLTLRIINNLLSDGHDLINYKDKIVIANDLFPSDLLKMTSEQVAGVVLVSGGVTSHLSILARSLELPMVFANDPDLLKMPDGTDVLLDAHTGNIYINPSQEVINEFANARKESTSLEQLKANIRPQTLTSDGVKITLLANINLLMDLKTARDVQCEGIGLYRTEFPFIIRNDFPSEQEQFIIYRKLIDQMDSKPIVFRTLDVGGDKVLSYYQNAKEQNPAIGLRSIRFSLQNPKVFQQQIRAILRAGHDADLRIMFPMISSLDEFDRARSTVYECIGSLRQENTPFNANPKIGMMVELPSVVEIIDEFARETDFFSIGTNDFIQFMLGVDRTNENVADFYLPYHPSVLRAMAKVVESANRHGKAVSVCGGMGSDEKYIKFLIGIGLRTLSIAPSSLPHIQNLIEELDTKRARDFANQILGCCRASEIAKIMFIEPSAQ